MLYVDMDGVLARCNSNASIEETHKLRREEASRPCVSEEESAVFLCFSLV